jgi:hypothetical protein
VRRRSRRRTVVVWTSSASAPRHSIQWVARPSRAAQIRWWLRVGVLFTLIGLMRLARIARTHPRPALSLAGTAITVAGITAASGAVLVSGFVVLLVALFLPSDAGQPRAVPCSGRLWARPCTPWVPSARYLPPQR